MFRFCKAIQPYFSIPSSWSRRQKHAYNDQHRNDCKTKRFEGNVTIYRRSPNGFAQIPGVRMSTDRDVQQLQETAHSALRRYRPQTAGISLRGRTDICSFTGIMDRYLYTNILQQTLLLFIDAVHPDSLRFVTDNNLKHSSNYAKDFLWTNIVNWWRTPAELPDLNLIENVWHEMKEYARWELNWIELILST